jgi:hypothetical protein
LIVNSWYYGAFPSVGINIVWIGIGGYALLRARRLPAGADPGTVGPPLLASLRVSPDEMCADPDWPHNLNPFGRRG